MFFTKDKDTCAEKIWSMTKKNKDYPKGRGETKRIRCSEEKRKILQGIVIIDVKFYQ